MVGPYPNLELHSVCYVSIREVDALVLVPTPADIPRLQRIVRPLLLHRIVAGVYYNRRAIVCIATLKLDAFCQVCFE